MLAEDDPSGGPQRTVDPGVLPAARPEGEPVPLVAASLEASNRSGVKGKSLTESAASFALVSEETGVLEVGL